MDTTNQYCQAMGMMHVLLPIFMICGLVFMAIIIVPFWQIFKKAGFPPALSFLMVVPLVHFVMLYVLAFSQWKVVPAPVAAYTPPVPPPYTPPAPPQS